MHHRNVMHLPVLRVGLALATNREARFALCAWFL